MKTKYKGFYEDFHVGDEFVSPARTLTEADIVAFAGISGDYNQLHMDAEYAKRGRFGARIAHGLLGLTIASGLSLRIKELGEENVVAFLGLTWNYLKPVFIGDTLHVVQSVADVRETKQPGVGLVVFAAAVINQHGERVQEGEWKLLYKMRAAQGA